ncbi:MAG: hypothetical protein PHC29_06805 [Candidatus Omnitrophica bacterium]|nr:hypothetical protein [Candidatus Omnitrophota bacterium]
MIICKAPEIVFSLKGKCSSCCREYSGEGSYSLSDIVPSGLCPFAYYSIIPYWVSFKEGAWFRWRNKKSDVFCQCPRTEGIVFLVRIIGKSRKTGIEAEVVGIGNDACPNKHRLGQIFKIEHDKFCPAIFPSLWSKLDEIQNISDGKIMINCCLSESRLLVFKR